MGILSIVGLVLDLVTKFGPKAKALYDGWTQTVPPGTEPTPEMWADLKNRIDTHDPDTY